MEQITDATVIVNNQAVGIQPNSLAWNPGKPEAKARPMSVGGGKVEQVFSQDLETSFGMVKFALLSTKDNLELVDAWEVNKNRNVVQIVVSNDDGEFTRTFTQAFVANRPERPAGTEANVEVEFHSNAAI